MLDLGIIIRVIPHTYMITVHMALVEVKSITNLKCVTENDCKFV